MTKFFGKSKNGLSVIKPSTMGKLNKVPRASSKLPAVNPGTAQLDQADRAPTSKSAYFGGTLPPLTSKQANRNSELKGMMLSTRSVYSV